MAHEKKTLDGMLSRWLGRLLVYDNKNVFLLHTLKWKKLISYISLFDSLMTSSIETDWLGKCWDKKKSTINQLIAYISITYTTMTNDDAY